MSELTTSEKKGVLIIHFKTDCIRTEADVTRISEELANLTHSGGGKVVLDFNQLQQMSSMMIGRIMALSQECKDHQIKLKLCSLQPHIREVFRTTGLNRLLKVYDTQDKAVASFRKKSWFG
jgi:anti-sigma B factor antagonist